MGYWRRENKVDRSRIPEVLRSVGYTLASVDKLFQNVAPSLINPNEVIWNDAAYGGV